MPRPRKSPVLKQNAQPNKPREDASWGGFVNVTLDDTAAARFNEWYAENADHIFELLTALLESGFKFTWVYDEGNTCWISSLTGHAIPPYDGRFRQTLSARAGMLHESLALVIFKHVVLLQGVWSEVPPKGKTFSWG